MARGDALMRALGGHPTGKVDPMADESTTTEEETNEEETEETTEETTEEETPEQIKAERDRLKAQAAKARTAKAREAKAKADEERRKAKEGDDAEALKAQLAAAEEDNRKLRETTRRAAAKAAAVKAGAIDPDVAARLIDYDAMNDPTDEDELAEVFGALLEEKPYLKKAQKAKSDAGKGGKGSFSGSTDLNAVIRRARGR